MKPRILFLTNTYYPHLVGGAEQLVQSIAEGFSNREAECAVLTLGHSPQPTEEQLNGVKIFRVPPANVYHPCTPLVERRGLKKAQFHVIDAFGLSRNPHIGPVLDRFRPNLVNTHNLCGFSTACLHEFSRRKIPVVHTLHDYYLVCANTMRWHAEKPAAPQCAFCRVANGRKSEPLNQVSHVIGVSRHILDVHRSRGLFRDTPGTVVHNGRPLLGTAKIRHPDSAPLTFGFMGRVEKTKGVETLLGALSQIPDLRLRLLIAGRGDDAYVDYLKSTFPDPRVAFLGFSHPAEFFPDIDVAIYPSLWEEALSGAYEPFEYGIPSIGSRIGGIPEVIDEGTSGFLFEPGNRSELAAIIRDSVENPGTIRAMDQACRTRRNYFTTERVLAGYQAVYESVLHPLDCGKNGGHGVNRLRRTGFPSTSRRIAPSN